MFIDVEFKNCPFSSASEFLGCTFDGTLSFISCESVSEIRVIDPTCSKEAEFALNIVRNADSRAELKRAFAEDALGRALKKFKGDYGLKSIQVRHHKTGFKQGNPYNERIWELLARHKIIQNHAISNVSEGGMNIFDDKELRREIAAFLDNGVLGRRLRAVVDDLIV